MAFADDFLAHVYPKLKRACDAHGVLIVCGETDWTHSFHAILHFAINRGALHLTEGQFERLREWLSQSLLAACIKHEPSWIEAKRVASRIARDPVIVALCG